MELENYHLVTAILDSLALPFFRIGMKTDVF